MGEDDAVRQGDRHFRPLVAFDFDGTLTARDSFQDFLAWRTSSSGLALGTLKLAPAAWRYLCQGDRAALKEAMVRQFLGGLTRTELWTQTRRFAAERSRALLRPDALLCWKRWQARGARLVIVTASPAPVVAPFAHGLGADRLIATKLVFDQDDKVTGVLDGANCRGPEKVARLRAVYGDDVTLEAAYGDSRGDREMLLLAGERGMRVFKAKP